MLATDDDLLATAESWKRDGRGRGARHRGDNLGLGAAPGRQSSRGRRCGHFLGSVSGGCVEGEVVTEAIDIIAAGGAKTLEFGVADETAWRAACHAAAVSASMSRGSTDAARRAAGLECRARARRPAVLVTDLASGEQRLVSETMLAGDPLAEALATQLRMGKSGEVDVEGRRTFLTVQEPPIRLVAIGAVHISQALAPLATVAGLDVTIVDPRTAFATPERFGGTRLVAAWPDEAFATMPLDRFTAVAALSHDPKIDDPALAAALAAGCFYVGALGSRKSHAARLGRLGALGFDAPTLGRIHAPIGLDIGAVSPAEIAVSVLGEIIASLRKKPLRADATAAAA